MKYDYIYPARVSGNKSDLYINPLNCEAFIDARKATNFLNIDFTGVNHICINRKEDNSFYIFSVSGYTYERGLFIDQYQEATT